jgi:uncharacterized secreted protein with C-terminal beta-propeller domain
MKGWSVLATLVLLGLGVTAVIGGPNSQSLWFFTALFMLVSAWYLLDGRRDTRTWFPSVIIIALTAVASASPLFAGSISLASADSGKVFSQNQLKKFSSYEELVNFVAANADYNDWYYPSISSRLSTGWGASNFQAVSEFSSDDFSFTIGDSGSTPTSFSTTNIQTLGIDEADIVKNDSKYIYVVSRNRIIIIDAYPAENARIVSEIQENGWPQEIFINGNKLVVLGSNFVRVYDVSNKEHPALVRDVSFDGWYFSSRMAGGYVYVIVNTQVYNWHWENGEMVSEVKLPVIRSNGDNNVVQADEIYYFDVRGQPNMYVTILAIDTQDDDNEITSKTILMNSAQNIFVSSSNVYLTYQTYTYESTINLSGAIIRQVEKTIIHKIAMVDGQLEYMCWGEVPGRVLNQFSMDEHDGYLRVATTTGDVWGNTSKNHLYILDESLTVVGKLENLAPTERIYSARFMGDRAYLVTFRRVDPLFILDLSDPCNPRVLGELEIPGYSDYLHPYDETHIIGIGRDDGVKIALFDVSDPTNPVEVSKYEVGTSWSTNSSALTDHRAFLFSRSRNILVVPIGSYYDERAHIFNISVENGIALRGTITHQDNSGVENNYYSYWYYYRNSSVKRSLYIENVLYTISDGRVKMNSLVDLGEINTIEIENSVSYPYYRSNEILPPIEILSTQ